MTKMTSHSSEGRLQVMWHWIWMQETTWKIGRLQKTAMMRPEGNGGFGPGEWNADDEIDIDIIY
jgi:hypothetical protein